MQSGGQRLCAYLRACIGGALAHLLSREKIAGTGWRGEIPSIGSAGLVAGLMHAWSRRRSRPATFGFPEV